MVLLRDFLQAAEPSVAPPYITPSVNVLGADCRVLGSPRMDLENAALLCSRTCVMNQTAAAVCTAVVWSRRCHPRRRRPGSCEVRSVAVWCWR